MRPRPLFALPAVAAAALALSACSTQAVNLPGETDPEIQAGAQIFDQRCAGCHTLDVAGAQGSSFNVNSREYKDGPNFNQREITYEQILYAIRNGGFSSGPMPQNIVVGEEAEAVSKFLAKYAGGDVGRTGTPGTEPPAGVSGESPVEGEASPEGSPTPDSAAPPPGAAGEGVDNAEP